MFSLRATLILFEYFQVSEKYIPTIAGGNELTKQVTACGSLLENLPTRELRHWSSDFQPVPSDGTQTKILRHTKKCIFC